MIGLLLAPYPYHIADCKLDDHLPCFQLQLHPFKLSFSDFLIRTGLHLEPDKFLTAVKWWLGLDSSRGSCCALGLNSSLGHQVLSCKCEGDFISQHNHTSESNLGTVLRSCSLLCAARSSADLFQ